MSKLVQVPGLFQIILTGILSYSYEVGIPKIIFSINISRVMAFFPGQVDGQHFNQ